MTTLLDLHPPHPGNGRAAHPDTPETYRGLGFGFVRRFLLIILLTVGLLVVLGGLLLYGVGMDMVVEGKGIIEPAGRRQVKAEIAGTVLKVCVTQWQRVVAGDTLLTLDDAEWRTELEKAGRELAANRSRRAEIEAQMAQDREVQRAEVVSASLETQAAALQFEQTEREYRLYYDLYPRLPDGGPRPPVESLLPLRLRRAALQRAEADRQRAEVRLRAVEGRRQEVRTQERMAEKLEQDRALLRRRLGQAVLCAPVSGTILTGDLERRVGDRLQAGEAVLELSDLSGWEARVMVREADLPKVRPGQAARLYISAFPHLEYKIFEGVVEETPARPAPESVQAGDPLYPVRVSIRNPAVSDGERAYSLTYGMRLEARITVDRGRIAGLLWRRLLRAAGKVGPRDFHLLGRETK